jgi:hypothetical protein
MSGGEGEAGEPLSYYAEVPQVFMYCCRATEFGKKKEELENKKKKKEEEWQKWEEKERAEMEGDKSKL